MDYKRADIDFSSQAAKLKESGAEAVILQAVYREPPRLAEQCHAIGYNPLFIGPSPIVLDKTIELGGKHVEGVMGVEVYPLRPSPARSWTSTGPTCRSTSRTWPWTRRISTATRRPPCSSKPCSAPGKNLTRDSLFKAIEYDQGLGPGLGPQVQLRR